MRGILTAAWITAGLAAIPACAKDPTHPATLDVGGSGADSSTVPATADASAIADGATTDDATGADSAPDSSTPVDGGRDSAVIVDSGIDTGVIVDSGPVPLNGCVTFTDATAVAANRSLIWDFSIGVDPMRCLTIKVGQTVTWVTPTAFHPLTPQGGDVPTPIPTNETVNGVVTFPNAGKYGYVCANHTSMNGAIQVVP